VRNAITPRRYPATIKDQAPRGLYIRTTSRSTLGRFDCSTPDFNMARNFATRGAAETWSFKLLVPRSIALTQTDSAVRECFGILAGLVG